MTASSALADRLGLPSGARAVILNADDFGMCHAANAAISGLLARDRIDSATVMVPCAWSPEALAFAAAHPDLDVGVHLVLTSEWRRYRWRPLTAGSSTLVDADGFFPADVATVEQHASEEDVAAEIAAQLQAALDAGVDVTHLDNHMGSVYGLLTGRDFLRAVFELAARHGLPFRLPREMEGADADPMLQAKLTEAAAVADAFGVEIVDRLWTHPFELRGEGTADEESYEQVRDGFLAVLRAVPPGVTEIYLHPMADGEELRAAVDFAAAKRGYELRLLDDPLVQQTIVEEGLVRVGWRALRELQRGDAR
ncbi:polysaccharide deacetylase family protein [Microbacterium paraoxydans]|uniref:polysaccharide deacetylase family protein n=1 Tax=Microbacterium paraoxydans TaxID=199592 RepID=UPI002285FAEB|nr:polysaccharide deacetylase family protein [Microbacterium paraoxydans]MCZ0710096.1 polysaccharide deacetylase family protein [Microbacterium paraoxydans]